MKPDGVVPVKQKGKCSEEKIDLLNDINGLLEPIYDLLNLVISSGDAHPDALSLARDTIHEFMENHQ